MIDIIHSRDPSTDGTDTPYTPSLYPRRSEVHSDESYIGPKQKYNQNVSRKTLVKRITLYESQIWTSTPHHRQVYRRKRDRDKRTETDKSKGTPMTVGTYYLERILVRGQKPQEHDSGVLEGFSSDL